jgi:ubiquinol-cytochrome c reductase cytochrome b subunit
MAVMFLMPILGRWNLGHRFNVAFTLAILGGAGLLTALALNEDYCARWIDPATFADVRELHEKTEGDPAKIAAALGNDPAKIADFKKRHKKWDAYRHSQAFLDAAVQAKVDAERSIELAGRPEKIPPAGALELVRNDALSQGPKLFAQHCASCHAHVDPAAAGASALLAKASAANLFEFGKASWMRGLLDPKQVAGPAYFGNTAHKEGDMVNFVTNDLTDRDTWKPADIEAVIAAMAAEAGFADAKAPPDLIEKGRTLIADGERCGGCHKFGDNDMELGSAPDITGWGSKEWLVGILTDPTHERFYGDSNDRMPSFGKADEGAMPLLTSQQIGLVADWLRGEWYRPAAAAH